MNWLHIETVIVPVDLCAPDPSALTLALQATSEAGGVHVVTVLSPLEPSLLTPFEPHVRRRNAERSLRAWLTDQGVPESVTCHVSIGDPATKVADIGTELCADLIIVPSHGRRGLMRALLGSVAERITRLATCPVLVLRHPETSSPRSH